MIKVFNLLLIFFFLCTSKSFGHAQHYNKLKYLKYNLYLNNELIGSHTFNFIKNKNILKVTGQGSFKISKFGVNIMDYHTASEGHYNNNQLIKFSSKTEQNDKKKYVNIEFDKNNLVIDGSSFKGITENNSIISSWWNHEIVKATKQISSISGRIIDQKVKFLGKKVIIIGDKSYETLNFHLYSDDNKPMNEKKLNIKIWYDVKTLMWIKASYKKFGDWEYRISSVKF